MKKILAKLKNDQHYVLFPDADTDSLRDLYKIPNVSLALPFAVETRPLAEGEWYFMVLTEEQKEEMLGGYATERSAMLLDPIRAEHYAEISAIYVVSGQDTLFSKVAARHIVRSQKCVAFSEKEQPRLVEQSDAIALSGEVDAYWNGTLLYFKKFTTARSLFPGIHKIYRDATEKETNEFLSSELFELKDEMSSHFIGLRNRKLIAGIIAGKVVDLKDSDACRKYLAYAEQYNLDLEIDSGKIALIDNSDIAKVLSLLGESFYTTDITREKREIRTSRKLVVGKRKRAR